MYLTESSVVKTPVHLVLSLQTWDIILVLEQTGELSVHATLCACFWRQLLLFLLLPVCAFAALNIITAPYAFHVCEWRLYL